MSWQEKAACRTGNPADFSPVDVRGRVDLVAARLVAAVHCGPCPVRAECLGLALTLEAKGIPPQELVQAGLFWPSQSAGDTTPIDLLWADEHNASAAEGGVAA